MSKEKGRESKPHIAILGRCNSGKSTLLNFIVDSQVAIVSPQSGTTTDVVRKSYEIRDFAPVIFIDTAGVDDLSPIGEQRVRRTLETIYQVDLALVLFQQWGEPEIELSQRLARARIPYILVYNRVGNAPLGEDDRRAVGGIEGEIVEVDAKNGTSQERDRLLEQIKRRLPKEAYRELSIFGELIEKGDLVLLICPIDEAAPAGRLILPQVRAIRELLESKAVVVVIQPSEITSFLEKKITPKLAVTDSQAFEEVVRLLPKSIELTSFSILLAVAKGDYELYKQGLERVESLKNGDKILISESCSHQVSCEDIGRVKIPRWLEQYTGVKLRFDTVTGIEPLPDDLASYAMMIQCGGCMVTRTQLQNRIRRAADSGVAVTNYGMLIRKLRQ